MTVSRLGRAFKEIIEWMTPSTSVVCMVASSFRVAWLCTESRTDPERAVSLSLLEPGERWKEHLIDDVNDPVVHLDIRLKNIRPIDLNAFSHLSSDRA